MIFEYQKIVLEVRQAVQREVTWEASVQSARQGVAAVELLSLLAAAEEGRNDQLEVAEDGWLRTYRPPHVRLQVTWSIYR